MKRGKFWKMVRRHADFMIDKHAQLVVEQGEEKANADFNDAIVASNLMVRLSSNMPLEDRLNASLHHVAFAVAALWLDFEASGVENAISVPLPEHDENGEAI